LVALFQRSLGNIPDWQFIFKIRCVHEGVNLFPGDILHNEQDQAEKQGKQDRCTQGEETSVVFSLDLDIAWKLSQGQVEA
jgi:hypothetical protein